MKSRMAVSVALILGNVDKASVIKENINFVASDLIWYVALLECAVLVFCHRYLS